MAPYAERKENAFIAVHCSATRASLDIGEAEIRKWHTERGWSDIGYNIVIRRSGLVEIGRPIDYRGAHVEGYNDRAVGVCLVGGLDAAGKAEDNFLPEQYLSLLHTLRFLRRYAPGAVIQGHRDFPGVKKDCPCFDVRAWLLRAAPDLL
jgi:hypothetical protein